MRSMASRRTTRVGYSRLAHLIMPISGKPEIGGGQRDACGHPSRRRPWRVADARKRAFGSPPQDEVGVWLRPATTSNSPHERTPWVDDPMELQRKLQGKAPVGRIGLHREEILKAREAIAQRGDMKAKRVGAGLTAAPMVEEGREGFKIGRATGRVVACDFSDQPLHEGVHLVDVNRRHQHRERAEILRPDNAAAAETAGEVADAPAFAPGSRVVGGCSAGAGLNDDRYLPESRPNLGGEVADDGFAVA